MQIILRILVVLSLFSSACKTHSSANGEQGSSSVDSSSPQSDQAYKNCELFAKRTASQISDCSTLHLEATSNLYLLQNTQTSTALGLADTSSGSSDQGSGMSQGEIAIIATTAGAIGAIAIGAIAIRAHSSASKQGIKNAEEMVPPPGEVRQNHPGLEPVERTPSTEPSHGSVHEEAPVRPEIRADSLRTVAKDTVELESSKIFGSSATGKTSIKIVNSLDSVPLTDWGKPQLVAFKHGDLLAERQELKDLVEGRRNAPLVITEGDLQYTFVGVHESLLLVKVTKGMPKPAQTLHAIFPDFEPTKALGGGITGDVFLGTYQGQEVVAKRITQQNEWDAMHVMKDSEVIVPVKNAAWAEVSPGIWERGVLMQKAKGDGQHAIDSADFDFNAFAQDTSVAILGMHEKGWGHMDIKPENFLQLNDGKYVLADFGSSSRFGPHEGFASDPKYADPWRSMPGYGVNPASDTYSMGLMLGHVYLKKVKGVTAVVEPDFKLLEAWRDGGRQANDPNLAKYFEQVAKFKKDVYDELEKVSKSSSGPAADGPAYLFQRMMLPPNHPNFARMEEAMLRLKNQSF